MSEEARESDGESAEANPYAAPLTDAAIATKLRWSFSVPMAIALTGIIAVTAFLNFGLGVIMGVMTIPAYIRAVRRSSVRFTEGESVTNSDRLLTFLGSLVLVLVFAGAAIFAFFITCTGGFFSGDVTDVTVPIILIVSACAGLLAFGSLYWWSWPRRKQVPPKQSIDEPEMKE